MHTVEWLVTMMTGGPYDLRGKTFSPTPSLSPQTLSVVEYNASPLKACSLPAAMVTSCRQRHSTTAHLELSIINWLSADLIYTLGIILVKYKKLIMVVG